MEDERDGPHGNMYADINAQWLLFVLTCFPSIYEIKQ